MAMFIPDKTIVDGQDWSRIHLFYKSFYRQALLNGDVPLWNPFSGIGRPFLADVETATLYPLNLVYLSGLSTGLLLSLALHFAIILAGGLRFASLLGCGRMAAWFGSLGFALGAPLLGRLQSGQIQVFCTICWLPLVLAYGCALQDKPSCRAIVRFSGSLALMFLAGSPPFFWVCVWCVCTYLFVRKPGMHTALYISSAAVLSAGLVSAQAIPFLELVGEGNRAIHDPHVAVAFSQQGGSWTSLFRSKPPHAYFNWEYNLYMGFPVFIAAVCSIRLWRHRYVYPLVAIGILFGVLAVGNATPVPPWLATHVPGWGAFRFPARYAVVTAFAIAFLAAVWLETWFHYLRSKKWYSSRLGFVAATVILSTPIWDSCRSFVERSNIYAGTPMGFREEEIADYLRNAGLLQPGMPPPRVFAASEEMRENSGMIAGYSTLVGFSNPMIGRVWHAMHTSAGVATTALEPIFMAPDVFSLSSDRFRGVSLAAFWPDNDKGLVVIPPADPRVFMSHAYSVVTDWREANLRVANGHPFRRVALLESDCVDLTPSKPDETHDLTSETQLIYFDCTKIVASCKSTSGGLIVFSEVWYPGWICTIDSEASPVIPANGWMRAVKVPKGDLIVSLTYRPSSFFIGCTISLLTLSFMVFLWFHLAEVRCLAKVWAWSGVKMHTLVTLEYRIQASLSALKAYRAPGPQ